MKKYQLLGGGVIEAETAEQFVSELNGKSMFGKCNTNKEFMKHTAARCRMQNGKTIRTKNYIVFQADLIKFGFVKII